MFVSFTDIEDYFQILNENFSMIRILYIYIALMFNQIKASHIENCYYTKLILLNAVFSGNGYVTNNNI